MGHTLLPGPGGPPEWSYPHWRKAGAGYEAVMPTAAHAGAPLVPLTWRGPWAAGTTYAEGDAVSRIAGGGTSSFVSIVAGNKGNDPATDGEVHWNLLAEHGAAGAAGAPGAEGKEGKEGKLGPEGPKGTTGEKGEKGTTGLTGATGPEGPKGTTGEKGEKGTTGEKGETGAAGKVKVTAAGASTERAKNTEFTPSATEGTLVLLIVKVKGTGEVTTVKVTVGGVLLPDLAISPKIVGDTWPITFAVAAALTWKYEVAPEANLEVARSTYWGLG